MVEAGKTIISLRCFINRVRISVGALAIKETTNNGGFFD
jgi:hypothetical protein